MSWRHYHLLSEQPDFTNAPQTGVVDDRDTFAQGTRSAWMAWPDQTDRIFSFAFQTFTQAEWRTLREFFDRHAGRAKAFYLPTWSQDFTIATDAAVGSMQITATGHWLSDNLTANRPDTTGRRIFTINQAGAFEPHWIMAAVATGENDVLTLAEPIKNEIEAVRTMAGICHLARLAEDTIQSTHQSPDHVSASLTFRTVNHRRRLDQIEPCIADAVGTMKPMESLVVIDADPLGTGQIVSTTKGPASYGTPQTANFYDEWTATFNHITRIVTLTGPQGYNEPMPHFNSAGVIDQIALTFDSVGNAILAWSEDRQTTIARGSEGATRLTFDGYSPVAQNTFSVDGLSTAGTSTVAIFYLREDDATIHCRIASESFATEHAYCRSPIAPIWIASIRKFESRLELVGMDASHRLARWISETYPDIPVIEPATALISFEGGAYRDIAVATEGIELTDITLSIDSTSAYRSVTVAAQGTESPASGYTITGAFVNTTIMPTTTPEAPPITITGLNGVYKLEAIITEAPIEPAKSLTIANPITGTYA